MKFRKLSACILTVSLAAGIQLIALGSAHAAADTDLNLTAYRNFGNQTINIRVCNDGSTSIKSITFAVSATNITYDQAYVSPFDVPPSDGGTFDVNTLTWTGLLAGSECVNLGLAGNDTGILGDNVTTTIGIQSSIQVDDTVNVDNSGNESVVLNDFTVSELPDISTEARLATTGVITDTTEVEYEINVRNIGAGTYYDEGFNIFAFTLPPSATFVSATDEDNGDALTIGNNSCNPAGTLGVDINIPGLGDFAGRNVVVCVLTVEGGQLPSNSEVYPFSIRIVAGAGLASGTADVVGIFEGNDPGTKDLFMAIANGQNVIDIILDDNNDNVFFLNYDPQALQMTASRCPGQGETTTNGTGCFRVSFNKDIYEPSFSINSLELVGSGTIQSLTKVGDNLWEVIVTGITRGSTTTLRLVAADNPNSVKDYSAVTGSVFVLGESTIRFDVEGAAAGGTLPETGMNLQTLFTALTLLILGLCLKKSSDPKQVKVRV